jgi:hypothetical protein
MGYNNIRIKNEFIKKEVIPFFHSNIINKHFTAPILAEKMLF